MNTVKVGDQVYWGTLLGRPPSIVTITAIDLCSGSGVKYGVPVEAVPAELLSNCCVNLNNGHWAFGYEITPVKVNQ